MRVSLDDLREYGDNLGAIAEEAESEFRRLIGEYMADMPDFAIWTTGQKAGLANYAAEAMHELWDSYGSASCSLGIMQLDAWLEGGLPAWPDIDAPGDVKAAAQSANYWKKFLFGRDGKPGDVGKFVDGCCSFIARKVSHASDVQMAKIAQRIGMEGRGIRYARVPVGPTCGFCIMLASRGFDYASKKSAGDIGARYNTFHNGCNCRVVAGYDGLEVEGYDPDGLYDRYLQCRETIGNTEQLLRDWDALSPEERDRYGRGERAIPLSEDPAEDARLRRRLGAQADGFNDYVAHRIAQEMDTRDKEWLYSGKLPQTDYSLKSREVFERSKEGRLDLRVHRLLEENGFDFYARPENAPDGYSNIDLGRTNGELWEIKCPDKDEGGSERYIESNVRKTIKQFRKYYQVDGEDASEARLIFSNISRPEDDDWAFERLVFECERHGIARAYFIGKDEKLRRVR